MPVARNAAQQLSICTRGWVPLGTQEGAWKATASLSHVDWCMSLAQQARTGSVESRAPPSGRSPRPYTSCALCKQTAAELFHGDGGPRWACPLTGSEVEVARAGGEPPRSPQPWRPRVCSRESPLCPGWTGLAAAGMGWTGLAAAGMPGRGVTAQQPPSEDLAGCPVSSPRRALRIGHGLLCLIALYGLIC